MPLFGQKRRDYENKRRAEWKVKVCAYLGGKCAVCGTVDNLEIHHKNPEEKEFHVSRGLWSRKWEIQVIELDKCELRCELHHKDAHAAMHGSIRKYQIGCRCEECIVNFRIYNKNQKTKYRALGKDKTRKNYRSTVAGVGHGEVL